MKKILLVEDDPNLGLLLQDYLQLKGKFEVVLCTGGEEGLQAFTKQSYDLLILDVMLPDTNGIDLCREIRQTDNSTPILMLTALNQVQDKVSGLKAGADDYLVKPFHFSELLARIEALMRRNKNAGNDHLLVFDDLKLDTWSKTAERGGKQISLTAKEYTLLELFMHYPNKILSREYIAEKVWEIHFDTGTNFIDVYVNYLRKKIEKDFKGKLIHTVIGMGYILKNPNRE